MSGPVPKRRATGAEVPADDDAHRLTSLPEAARAFFRRPGPRLMAATVVTSWARRAMAGGFTWREVPAAAITAAWWPFQEWLAHDKLLHLEPFEVAGRRVDLFAARAHRAHHRQPRGIEKTLLPFGVVAAGIPIGRALARLAIRDPKVRGTVMATYVTCSLVYEWTHFVVHTGVKPKSAFYTRIRRNHLFHHHLNENYWFGFTWPDVDRWMGTEPDPKTVRRSPTVRDLHGLAEEDARSA